jgi:hypothetical protein
MDLTFILAGLVGVAIGIGDYFRGKSSFFFFNVGFLNNWDRDDHPLLFWIGVLSWIVMGVFLIVCGFIRSFRN